VPQVDHLRRIQHFFTASDATKFAVAICVWKCYLTSLMNKN